MTGSYRPPYRRNHSEDNISRFKNSLSHVNWSEILDGVDANSDYNNFLNKFNELYDECIPMKKIQNQQKENSSVTMDYKGSIKKYQCQKQII